MAQASNLKRVVRPIPMPGITLNTTPTDYRPINGARRTDPQTYRNDASIFERALTRRSRRYRR